MSRPTIIADAASTPSKTAFDHETVPTLPNPNGKAPPNSSVMCPKTAEEALRSKPRGPATGAADDVTHKEGAQHPTQGGAAFAGAVATRRAQSAAAHVIEAEFEGEVIPSSKSGDGETGPAFSDAAAFEIVKRARNILARQAVREHFNRASQSPQCEDGTDTHQQLLAASLNA